MESKDRNKFVLILGIISSVISIITGFSNLIETRKSFAFLLVSMCVILLYILFNLKNRKVEYVESFVIKGIIFKYKGSRRFFIKSLIVLCFFILSILMYYTLSLYFSGLKFTQRKNCFNSELTSIGITNFSNEQNLSILLFEFLYEENLSDTIYQIKRINESYFNYISDTRFLSKFDSLGIKKGIIVSGKRDSNDELFYCKIRLKNFYPEFKKDTISSNIITIRNPSIHEFSIDYHAQILANFILGLLAYERNDIKDAEKLFIDCLKENNNSDNKKFIALCHVLLGNVYYFEKPEKAISEYKKAISYFDSKAAFLNIVNLYMDKGNYYQANKYYKKLKEISEADLNEVREKLDKLKYISNKNSSKKKNMQTKVLAPSGVMYFKASDSTKITIEYHSIQQFDYKSNTFFIFTANNDSLGIINSNGILISLPNLENLNKAENFIAKRFN